MCSFPSLGLFQNERNSSFSTWNMKIFGYHLGQTSLGTDGDAHNAWGPSDPGGLVGQGCDRSQGRLGPMRTIRCIVPSHSTSSPGRITWCHLNPRVHPTRVIWSRERSWEARRSKKGLMVRVRTTMEDGPSSYGLWWTCSWDKLWQTGRFWGILCSDKTQQERDVFDQKRCQRHKHDEWGVDGSFSWRQVFAANRATMESWKRALLSKGSGA